MLAVLEEIWKTFYVIYGTEHAFILMCVAILILVKFFYKTRNLFFLGFLIEPFVTVICVVLFLLLLIALFLR